MRKRFGRKLIFNPHVVSLSKQRLQNTAMNLSLCSCHVCGLVSRLNTQPLHSGLVQTCTRCHTVLHSRKPKSLSRSWSLLITAFMLYVPANIMPIMDTSSLFKAQRDTILSGIIYLWHSGSWALAVLVFFASIVTPLFKMLTLTFLLISVQFNTGLYPFNWHPQKRTKLYRILRFIGRWSMLDIYMVTILVTLVQVKSLTQIQASPGAIAFAGVVILTMLAVETFDPRLIWDSAQRKNDDATHLPILESKI